MYQRTAAMLALGLSLFAITTSVAFASTGTIVSPDQYAWDDNGGYVNWLAVGGNVTVTDTGLTGYIWSAGFGWINLSPTDGGVTNVGGVLGGYAWGTNTGWINFTGVTIDSNGLFHGHTVAQSTFGTMTFDCTYCDVVTSWTGSFVAPPTTPTPSPSPITGANGMPAQSGTLSYGYQATTTITGSASTQVATTTITAQTSTNVSPSLRPTTPPPSVEPTSAPPKASAYVSQHISNQHVVTAVVSQANMPTVGPSTNGGAPTPATNTIEPSPQHAPAQSTTPLPPTCSLFTCWIQGLFDFLKSIF